MKKHEICLHCWDEYIPKRRGTQKFCSNSCRSRHWFEKKNKKKLPARVSETLPSTENHIKNTNTNTKKESINMASIGNATAGSLIADGIKSLLTKTENSNATKQDIQELKDLLINRYLPVNNLPYNYLGLAPYYDIETGHIEYF